MVITILSKCLGLIRDAAIASTMGVSVNSDTYFYATNTITIIFAVIGGAIGATFIPFLAELEREEKKQSENFINNIISILILLSLIISIIGIVFADKIMFLFAPGFFDKFSIEDLNLAIDVTRIMFMSFVFMSLYNILKGILNSNNIYLIPASVDLIFNIVLVIYLIFLYKEYKMIGMAITIVIATAIQAIIQIPAFKKCGYRYRFKINLKDKNLFKILKLIVPIIIGMSVSQINMLVDKMLASKLDIGSMSIMNYATKVNLLLYTVVGMGITTVVYTQLSRIIAQKRYKDFSEQLRKSINLMSLIMIPCTLYIMIMSREIISFIYERGAFASETVRSTSIVLSILSIGMIFYGIKDLVNRAFYSLKDTRTPMINSAWAAFLNIIGNIVLINRFGINGLAISTTISGIIATILLVIKLKRKINIDISRIIKDNIIIFIISIIIIIIIKVTYKILLIKLINQFQILFITSMILLCGVVLLGYILKKKYML